jgi:2-polyprenyl-6-methoxyphenol hydroxylase-like FAD-dependent oxidoreductase
VDTARVSGVEIVLDSPVAGASPAGVLQLEDGSSLPADLVIGADGVYSKVRDSLGLARSVRDLGDGCGRHLIPRNSDDPVGTTYEAWSGGRRIGVVPCSPEQTYIFLCCPVSDVDGTDQQPFNRATWVETFPEFESQLARIPDNGEGRWASFYDVEAWAWHKGRVAILGDAAHAMSPNLGQAACVAMTNAVALGQALRAYNVEKALDVWQESERPMVTRVQRYSRFYGRVGTSWPSGLLDVRSGFIWALGKSAPVQKRINFAASYFPSISSS